MANTIADINIDMIGRRDEAHTNTNNYVYVIGADRLSSDLNNITANANKVCSNGTTNTMTLIQITFTNVLTIIILQRTASFCFIFNGVHADYHQKRIHQIKLNTTP
jgi:hypothetical protein